MTLEFEFISVIPCTPRANYYLPIPHFACVTRVDSNSLTSVAKAISPSYLNSLGSRRGKCPNTCLISLQCCGLSCQFARMCVYLPFNQRRGRSEIFPPPPSKILNCPRQLHLTKIDPALNLSLTLRFAGAGDDPS